MFYKRIEIVCYQMIKKRNSRLLILDKCHVPTRFSAIQSALYITVLFIYTRVMDMVIGYYNIGVPISVGCRGRQKKRKIT